MMGIGYQEVLLVAVADVQIVGIFGVLVAAFVTAGKILGRRKR